MQRFPSAAQARHDCADRHAQDRGGFCVGHLFNSNQNEHGALLWREAIETSQDITDHKTFLLRSLYARQGVHVIQRDFGPKPIALSDRGYEKIVEDGKEPCPQIAGRPPELPARQGVFEAVLDEVVCPVAVANKHPGIAAQGRDQRLDQRGDFVHETSIPQAEAGAQGCCSSLAQQVRTGPVFRPAAAPADHEVVKSLERWNTERAEASHVPEPALSSPGSSYRKQAEWNG